MSGRKPSLFDAFLQGLAKSGRKQQQKKKEPTTGKKQKAQQNFAFTNPGCGKC